ncbi:glycosyltransferase [Pedobacter rhizosphaerae]|uniref:Glycosyltransferase involved in cell wall bisynthesis n=1 Tax=Pedobacter rhizosphaerae TaxID=390241 RepID=A0A1H9V4Z2_9SPHI|nr:glycosyltransferase [Pedobacter rhizosphaerae]SES16343.1 Glycosyltransferase involved in cell wall bisynthesis [Pedobacter rhizosphaerae]
MKKILFITHNLGRTGSEMLLWYSLIHLNKEKFTPLLFTKTKGVLVDQLPAEIPHFLPYKKNPKRSLRFLRTILKIFKIDSLTYQLTQIHKKNNVDYWYVNTLVLPEVYSIANKLGVKIITHAHELPLAYNFNSYTDMERIITSSSTLIGCSKTVCEKISDMGRPDVKLLYGFIDANKIVCSKTAPEVKANTGFNNDDFVWAISGKTSLIKGVDFLASLVAELPDNVKFIWIGGEENTGIYYYAKKALENKFPGRVLFLGAQSDEYYNYLNSADAFLLLSREDSFPLVMLEAAALGKPIVGFNSGGISEFVNEQTGIVIDTWRAKDLASAMMRVKDYPEQFLETEIKAQAARYEVKKQVSRLEEILEDI